MKTLIIIALFVLSSITYAGEKLNIYWNCYLPGDVLSCDELKTSYLNAHSALVISSATDAYFTIILRSTELNNETSYQIIIDGAGNLPEHSVDYKIANGLSADIKFDKVLAMLNSMTTPFELILNADTGSETAVDKPYFIAPSVSGSGSQNQTTTNLNGYVGVVANYSTEKWRIIGNFNAGMNSSNQAATAFNNQLQTQVYFFAGGVGTIRSFSDNWSIAIMANDVLVNSKLDQGEASADLPESAKNNTATNATIKAGVEWIAVPFITSKTNGNIAIRYVIGGEHHKYVNPSSYEFIDEQFLRHTFTLMLAKHYNKVDINLNIGAFTSSLRPTKLQGISASTGISYRVTPQLTLGADFKVEYVQGRILSPAAGQASFVGLTGATNNNLFYNGSISLKYTIGNTRLFNNEQRWKE
jgi:hypothetical protein